MAYGVRICSFYEASGEGVDINGRVWRWEFSKQFGPLWIDTRGNPLKVQPAENSSAWPVFNRWHEARSPVPTMSRSEPLIGPRTCRYCGHFLAPKVRICEQCHTDNSTGSNNA